MADIFLSYSSKDKDRVQPLVRALEREGWTVWWDRKTRAGEVFDQLIEQELESSRGVVVVWSSHSVQSRWVRVEAEEGLGKAALFPVKIDPVKIPLAFRLHQAVDLVGWEVDSAHPEFQNLVQSIKEKIGKGENWSEPVLPKPPPPAPVLGTEHEPGLTPITSWPLNKILPIVGVIILVVGIIYGLIPSTDDQSPGGQQLVGEGAKPGPSPEPTSTLPGDRPTPTPKPKPVVSTQKTTTGYVFTLAEGITLEVVSLRGGRFRMGSENGISYQKPVHEVTVKPFSIGRTEVTQAQWQAVMENNPSNFKGERRPVEGITWYQAKDFCEKLSERSGYQVRLPTEAEWEYAARGGTTTEYSFGDDETKVGEYAWFIGNAGRQTHPVGKKKPNPFGLYDMHGNVWEWVEDYWHDDYNDAPTDGSAWLAGGNRDYRVLRGGSWYYSDLLRSSNRDGYRPDNSFSNYGFRVVVGAQTQSGK